MHSSGDFKKEFVKKWIEGLQICCSSRKLHDLMKREKKIKLSADVAMASAKNAATSWSRALISDANKHEEGRILVDKLLAPESQFKLQKIAHDQMVSRHRRARSKKILKKSCSAGKRWKKMIMSHPRSHAATCTAKRLVKKRTRVLKRLVPGGESMDEFSIVEEALDYIISLRVQVDVMRSLVNVAEVLNKGKTDQIVIE